MARLMEILLWVSILTVIALSAKVAHGEEVPDFSKALLVVGDIEASILDVADKLERLSLDPTTDSIQIIINSPGGGVEDGMALLSAMEVAKARGKKIECLVTHEAASMAFHTLAHCSTRYALPYATILYHEIYAGSMTHVTPEAALNFAIEAAAIEKTLDDYAFSQLGGTRADFNRYNKSQRLWFAETMSAVYPKFHLKVITNAIFPKNFKVFSKGSAPVPLTLPFIIPGLVPSH